MGRNKSKQARRAEKWAKERKRINWDVIWKVLASIFAFAGSMVAVYELVNYFRSDSRTFYTIIFPGLALIVWFIVLFQLFRKKNPYAILLLAFTVVGGIVGGIGWQSYNQSQEAKVVVLVAQFDGPEDTYGLRRQMMEDLLEATKSYDDTVINEGNELVTSTESARDLGEKAKADLVIWAWYRPTENPNITIHIENLSATEITVINESETYQPQATLAQLESFEIQKQLGSETSTLISFLTGLLRFEAGDYQVALERFQSILNAEDISTYIEPKTLYFDMGISYYMLGELDHSIQSYNKAIELDSAFGYAYGNRGSSYDDLGQHERAIEDYNLAIEINPNKFLHYYDRGLAYSRLKQYERAIEDFNKAIDLEPTFAASYGNRGNAYQFSGQYEQAFKDYNKVIELSPNDFLAYLNRGALYLDLGQYENALQDFNKTITLNSKFAPAYYNRGVAYRALGKTAEAEADFKKYEELTGQKP